MLSLASLLAASLGVGMLIGAVGVGGILLIPALTAFAGLSIHQAMATALFTFIFTGIVGTFLFQRRGSIDWHLTAPVCVGAALFGFLGAWLNARLEAGVLSLILAGVIVFAGAYTLSRPGAGAAPALEGRPRGQQALLLAIGAAAGFGSGLTGVGGPALSVPIMVLFGFPPLAAVGASQVVQILAAVSGTAGHLSYGVIRFDVAAAVVLAELLGVWIGVAIVHAADARHLRSFVGGLCIVVGAALTARALGG